jgi:hypothetical protein
MTPDERAAQLRSELIALGRDETDIAVRLTYRTTELGLADTMCLEAVDTILALRDEITALRSIIASTDEEITKIRKQVEILRDMLPEEVTDV